MIRPLDQPRKFGATLAIGLFCGLFLAGSPPDLRAEETPTAAVKSTIDEVVRLLKDEHMKKPEQLAHRRKLLEDIIDQRFDYEEISKRSLANHWKTLTDSERREFVELFKALLAHTYADKIEGYAGEPIQYLDERQQHGFAEVRTKVLSARGDIGLNFRLMKKGDVWQVYNVVVDGVSLITNYRGQFDRVIRNASYADLVEKLKTKSQDIQSP